MKRFLTLLLVVFALSLAAFAQTPVQTAVTDFGLVGSWGVNCQDTFDYSTFTNENSVVYEKLGIGDGDVRTKIYTAAVRLDATHLQVWTTYSDDTRLNGASFVMIYLRHERTMSWTPFARSLSPVTSSSTTLRTSKPCYGLKCLVSSRKSAAENISAFVSEIPDFRGIM